MERVVLVGDGLPDVEAYPHPERRAGAPPVVGGDGLLDGDRAADSLDRAGKGNHETVAQVLDLLAPGGGHGVAQEAEVGAADLLADVVAELAEESGRPDEVGEEQRDDARHVTPGAHSVYAVNAIRVCLRTKRRRDRPGRSLILVSAAGVDQNSVDGSSWCRAS